MTGVGPSHIACRIPPGRPKPQALVAKLPIAPGALCRRRLWLHNCNCNCQLAHCFKFEYKCRSCFLVLERPLLCLYQTSGMADSRPRSQFPDSDVRWVQWLCLVLRFHPNYCSYQPVPCLHNTKASLSPCCSLSEYELCSPRLRFW
jgi:hypothetical protein